MHTISKLLGGSILATAALMASASVSLPAITPYTSVVIFGDSLSDGGNNSNLPFVGGDPAQVISGNGYIPTQTYALGPFGTYSNGEVWASQFATTAGLSALPSVLGGTNYAFGGATTSGGLLPSLTAQAGMFLGAPPPGTNIASTLFVVAGGGNNARATFQNLVTQTDFGILGATSAAAASQYANDIGAIVDQLQGAGAQSIIVWNTPNIGLAPAIAAVPGTASGLTPTQLGSLISGSNNGALTTRLAGEAGVQIFDLYGLVAQASANGFTNTTDACGAPSNSGVCPDISTALFWDGIHPTTAAHGFIAQQMFALAVPVPEPSTYAMLFAGLLVISSIARRRTH